MQLKKGAVHLVAILFLLAHIPSFFFGADLDLLLKLPQGTGTMVFTTLITIAFWYDDCHGFLTENKWVAKGFVALSSLITILYFFTYIGKF